MQAHAAQAKFNKQLGSLHCPALEKKRHTDNSRSWHVLNGVLITTSK